MSTLLRLATAGSVDDGKSTLVGRLLHDTKNVLADQMLSIERVSRERGMGAPDLALLTDGLRAEREQGITIDVAHRYFATANRSFVLADCPGHVEYTRNMVTGSSTADAVVLLVDARHGVIEQTRRHLAVVALLRTPHVIVAVNKVDLVGYSQERFAEVDAQVRAAAAELGVREVTTVPVSALVGDNVAERSAAMPWYEGPSLLELIETIPVLDDTIEAPFRLPVQLVVRPQGAAIGADADPSLLDYRGYAGRITSGSVAVGDEVVVLPSGRRSSVAGIDLGSRTLERASAPSSVTIRLTDDVDVSRGDTLVTAEDVPTLTRSLDARLCWLSPTPLRERARVLVKHGTATVTAIAERIENRLDVDTLTDGPADTLELNDIGTVALRLASPIPAEEYARTRASGALVVVDPASGATLAAGMVESIRAER